MGNGLGSYLNTIARGNNMSGSKIPKAFGGFMEQGLDVICWVEIDYKPAKELKAYNLLVV